MEEPLNSVELPVFSDQTCEYIVIQKVQNHNNFKEEIIDQIIERDRNKSKETEKNIEVEHNIINFIDLQIGEKIRSLIEEKKFEISFDDMYYASLLITPDLQFYSKETTQKLIDYLFIYTKKFYTFIFSFYLLGFVLPFVSNIFIHDPQIKIYCTILGFITQFFFFVIEIIQMMDSGIYEYFQGWNIIDFSQFWLFIAHLIHVVAQANVEKNQIGEFDYAGSEILQLLKDFSPHIDFLILTLMIMKVLFFIRVFEAFGFLVQMLQLTISKLIPFFISFLVFVIYFAVSFYVLEGEVDPELEEYEGFFNKFTIIWISVYRTALGEVHNPIHQKLEEREQSISRDSQIFLLWIVWLVSTFIMIIILLNFLIAVIGQEYNSVIMFQELYSYRHKAELNLECYQFLQTFKTLPQYSYIVFSYNKDLAASRSHLQKEEQGESQMGAENKFLLKMIKKIIKSENKNTQYQVMQNREHIDKTKYDLISFQQKQMKVFKELQEIKELMVKAADPKTPVKK